MQVQKHSLFLYSKFTDRLEIVFICKAQRGKAPDSSSTQIITWKHQVPTKYLVHIPNTSLKFSQNCKNGKAVTVTCHENREDV